MSRQDAEQRIALLQARGHAQRLSAQLALLEAGEQLAPLRTVARVLGGTARAFAPGKAGGSVAGWLGRAGRDHPWLTSVLAAGALRWLRRSPLALVLAAAGAGAAWWLLRSSASSASTPEPTAPPHDGR
jgi:hypothetical protein